MAIITSIWNFLFAFFERFNTSDTDHGLLSNFRLCIFFCYITFVTKFLSSHDIKGNDLTLASLALHSNHIKLNMILFWTLDKLFCLFYIKMTCYIWIATNVKTNHIKVALMDRCQVCLISEAKFEHNPKDVTFWCHKWSTHTSTKLLANANSFVLAL